MTYINLPSDQQAAISDVDEAVLRAAPVFSYLWVFRSSHWDLRCVSLGFSASRALITQDELVPSNLGGSVGFRVCI